VITGGTGFIGTHTIAAPGRTGVPLRQLVHRRPAAIDGCTDALKLVQGNLTDPSSLVGLCTGVEAVVHLASEAGHDEQISTLVKVARRRRLMDAAQKAGVRRMIYLSTVAVYGDGGHSGINEDEIPPAPVSPASPDPPVGGAGRTRPRCDVSLGHARERLDGDPRLRHFEMIATGHFYAGSRLWELTGYAPPAARSGSSGYADWYRAELNGSRSWRSPWWPGSS
jgi:hypothetical protein